MAATRPEAEPPGTAARGERLFLVDAMGLLYRAHFAFAGRPLTTSAGAPVGALFGFVNTLLALLREEGARHVAVVLDSAGPTFRHRLYPEYKAHRPPLPPELAAQLPYLPRLLTAMGLIAVAREGLEADDLIGSLATSAVGAGWEAVIVSSDKDFIQLLGPGLRQFVPARGREPAHWIDLPEVQAKWGVAPAQFRDFLALSGDASDNIPGVSGVGPKTAASLLRQWGTLEGIYENLERVAPAGVREKLAAGREAAFLSLELASIRTDLMPAEPERFAVGDPTRRSAFRDLLRELEFRRLEERLFGGAAPVQGSLLETAPPAPVAEPRPGPPASDAPRPRAKRAEVRTEDRVEVADGWAADYRIAADEESLRGVLAACARAGGPLAVDTETSGLDARLDSLVGISLAWGPGRAAYIPIGHAGGPNLPLTHVRDSLLPLLAAPGRETIGQNLAFDLTVLARHGLAVRGTLRDTMVASYVIDPETRHGLDDLAQHWLAHCMVPIEALIGRGREQRSMADLPVERVAPYACEDADAAFRLWGPLAQRLEEVGGRRLFDEVEMPLLPVLLEMQAAGIALDASVLETMRVGLEAEMARTEAEIHRLAGAPFNVNSPKQLQTVLFERLKMRARRKTKTGLSTDQGVLEELAADHPLPRAVLNYRQLAKLKSTYVEALPRMIDPADGRVHTRFHQTVAATGRLSSSDPNLQNIPIRTAQGREIRKAFVAAPGHRLVSADYSQIELRVLAHFSGDEHLCGAFRDGEDVHRATAARVFGVAESAVTPLMRGRAKTINFGVIYGMGAQRLAGGLGISPKDAAGFIADYFAKLPGVQAYVNACVTRAREVGYAETLLGRRRYLPDLDSAHPRDRATAERVALNATLQGTAADLIKVAMVRLHAALGRDHPGARLLLQVHDELLLEVPENEVAAVGERARREMVAAIELRVPLKVDLGSGRTWFQAHA
jgi:DNA polymerase-1